MNAPSVTKDPERPQGGGRSQFQSVVIILAECTAASCLYRNTFTYLVVRRSLVGRVIPSGPTCTWLSRYVHVSQHAVRAWRHCRYADTLVCPVYSHPGF